MAVRLLALAYCCCREPTDAIVHDAIGNTPPNQAQKIDFIGGNDWGPGPHHLYIVRSIYCALLTPYGAEFARIRRHFCCQPNLLVADRFGG